MDVSDDEQRALAAHYDRRRCRIVVSMSLVVVSNVAVPLVSHISVWLTVAARLLTGVADALLQPSTSALITRWFPPSERAAAIGVVTGGRQIGTLMIMPLAGYLCSRHELLGGWPVRIFIKQLCVAQTIKTVPLADFYLQQKETINEAKKNLHLGSHHCACARFDGCKFEEMAMARFFPFGGVSF